MTFWLSEVGPCHGSKLRLMRTLIFFYYVWLCGQDVKFHNKLPSLLLSPAGFQKHYSPSSCKKQITLRNSHLTEASIITTYEYILRLDLHLVGASIVASMFNWQHLGYDHYWLTWWRVLRLWSLQRHKLSVEVRNFAARRFGPCSRFLRSTIGVWKEIVIVLKSNKIVVYKNSHILDCRGMMIDISWKFGNYILRKIY